jgi:AraC-like DNA-binding protein
MEDKDYIINFKELIDLHFKEHKEVTYYASKLDLSVHSLNKKAFRIEGKRAKEIINSVVLEKAKQKLIKSDDSIKDIAFSLGFYDPTYFFKFFSRHVGETPLAFRERME